MSCSCRNVKSFNKDFFGVGSSAGSVILEGLGLFKTFQRISAPKSFAIHFSHECFKFFGWAKDLINMVVGKIFTRPFSNLELFEMLTFAFPLTIFTFICTMVLRKKIYSYFIIVIVFTAFGVGIKMFQIHWIAGIGITIVTLIIIIIIIYKMVHIDKTKYFDMDENSVYLNISFTYMNTLLVMFALMVPIIAGRIVLGSIFAFATFLGFIIIPIIEGCCGCCNECAGNYDALENACSKSLTLANHLIPLLIIPSTESFFSIIQEDKIKTWNLIVGYVVISILFPIVFNLLNIFSSNPDLASKYKKTNETLNKYYFFELGDIGKQIIYSIFAEFNIIWGCVFIEIAWVALIVIFRPYKMKSDYLISILNSIVITFSNSVILYSNYHYVAKFSFKLVMIAFIIICIPAILSIFVYFIVDFHPNDNGSDESDEKEEHSLFISISIIYIAPIIWGFYGLNIWTIYVEIW